MNVSAIDRAQHELTFSDILDRAAARRVSAAVWDGVRWRTWRDCVCDAERAAHALHEAGLRAGDVLAVQLPNSWEFVVLHAATARLGILLLPLHMAYGAHELRSLLGRSQAAALVVRDTYRGRDRAEHIRAVREGAESLRHLWISEAGGTGPGQSLPLPRGRADLPQRPALADGSLLLLASSGTTSLEPKLCVHTHNGLLGNAAAVAADAGFDATDTFVAAGPFSHAFGLLSLHLALVTGGAVGLAGDWHPANFLDLLRASSATVAMAVPAQLRDLVSVVRSEPPLSTLREVRTGGAAVPADLVEAIRETFGARVTVQWGMTELGAGTYTRPSDPPAAAASSIGRPVTGGRARVVRPDGLRAAPGEVGELEFHSPHLFTGYLNAPDSTKAAFTADGWLRTGDLATLNEDGSVSHRGRADERINRGGLKFSATEVESLLSDLPQLALCAVVARPDPRLGQRSCLLATLRDGHSLTLAEVVGHLKGKDLATYKLPEELVIVPALPTTATGKVARARLAPLLSAGASTGEAG
jgi:cyclohexanecarboxylate-CoA ligase